MAKITVSTVHTDNTKPHRTVDVGWQHADDSQPSVQCIDCDTVGERNAMLDLAPNSVGCSQAPPFGYDS